MKTMIKLNNHEIKPTIFPDKTSQIWKIPEHIFKSIDNSIEWKFENEGEFMHLAQLKMLLDSRGSRNTSLFMEYMPYGRQDKSVSNEATFARMTLENLLDYLNFSNIYTVDIHSPTTHCYVESIEPRNEIRDTIACCNTTHVVFPDVGAKIRYLGLIENIPTSFCQKNRDQLTGEITGLRLVSESISSEDRVLIVDDICDRGRTFVEVAKILKQNGIQNIDLFVTHGIFSGEPNFLGNSGIKRIFTYKGEVFGK